MSAKTGSRGSQVDVAGAPAQYLTFMLQGTVFAIGILSIKEIIGLTQLTTVPMMPPAVRGVINLRGSVVPVIDLSVRFGKPASEIGKRTCVVIVEVMTGGERQEVGVIVDAVNEVLDIPASEMEPAPPFGSHIRSEFIAGIGKVAGEFVILLAMDHVLTFDELDGAQVALDAAGVDGELAA